MTLADKSSVSFLYFSPRDRPQVKRAARDDAVPPRPSERRRRSETRADGVTPARVTGCDRATLIIFYNAAQTCRVCLT